MPRMPSAAMPSGGGGRLRVGGPAVDHVYYRPPAPLDTLIEFIWAADGYPAQAPRERVLPSGAAALVIHLDAQPMRVFGDEHTREPALASCAFFGGARQTPLILDTALGATVGVHFLPGGARPFFDLPADAVAELALPLETLWGASVESLRAQLFEARPPLARVHVLRAALLARMRSFELPSALRLSLAAFEEPDLLSVAEVNRRTGLSPKRLLALFRDQVGLSPKQFWRVRRFRAAQRALIEIFERGAARA
jgi:AraC-like DNA-binding protein